MSYDDLIKVREHALAHKGKERATFTVAGIQAVLDDFATRESELLAANNRYQQEARDARAALRGGFQDRVHSFVVACFGREIAADGTERNHRFLEEALELVQALGCTASEAHQLVDYVFGRPVGDPHQETGGVEVTLAALCNAHGLDKAVAAENELTRVWGKIDKIRAKQAAKPKHSPLPEAAFGSIAETKIEEALRAYSMSIGVSMGHDLADIEQAYQVSRETPQYRWGMKAMRAALDVIVGGRHA